MSAILGIFDPLRRFTPEDSAAFVHGMGKSLTHRAPQGFITKQSADGLLSVAHGRHNPEHSAQPVASADGLAMLAYDGNIYNLPMLAAERNGAVGAAEDDPRIMLGLLRNDLTSIFPGLDGTFALAFYETGGPLVCARDIFGDKPLYWLESSGVLAFASELRALQTLPFFPSDVDMDALAEFISFQYVGAPRTLYSRACKLPPGHWLRCLPGQKASIHKFAAFTPGFRRPDTRPMEEQAEELEELLLRGLRQRCRGRSSIASCLSGGVDSSTVAALARVKLNLPVHTFSIGFNNTNETEHPQARSFAAHVGSTHHERLVTPDACRFLHDAGEIMDEPNGDSSCLPLFHLAAFVREHADMALAGDWADELFGGYGRYFATLAEEESGNATRLGHRYYSNRMLIFTDSEVRNLLGFMPAGYQNHLERLREEVNSDAWLHPLHRMRRTDMENYTPGAPGPKVERMGMRHGLEFSSPFMSLDLLRFAETLPPDRLVRGDRGKLILRQVAYKYLPQSAVDLPKRGFGLPMDGWGRQNVMRTARDFLQSGDSRLREMIEGPRLDAFLKRQDVQFNLYQVWALCVLESFLRRKPARLPELHAGKEKPVSLWGTCEQAASWARLAASIEHTRNMVVFIPPDSNLAALGRMLSGSVFVSATAIPAMPDSIIFDWRHSSDWRPLHERLSAKSIAFFPDNPDIPDPKLRRRLKKAGFKHVVIVEEGETYLLPTALPTFRERLKTMWTLFRMARRRARRNF